MSRPFLAGKKVRLPRAMRAGLTLLESTFVLLIISTALASAAMFYNNYVRNDHRVQAANQMNYVARAASHYINEHYAELMQQVQAAGGGPIVVNGIAAQGVPLTDLQSIYSKNYEVKVRRVTTPQGVPALQAAISTYGGEKMDREDMLNVSRLLGHNAGYLDRDGEWNSPFGNEDINVGLYTINEPHNVVLLLPMVDAGDNDSEGLFRTDVEGRDALNQMHTDLDMNTFEIRNAELISSDNLQMDTARLNSAELAFGRSDRMDVERDTRAGILEARGDLRVKQTLTTRDINTRGSDLDTRIDSGRLGSDTSVRNANRRGDSERKAGDLYTRDIRVAGELMSLPGGTVLPPVVTEGSACSPNGSIGRYNDPSFGPTILTCRDGRWGSNYRVSQEFRVVSNAGETLHPNDYRGIKTITVPGSEQWKMCFLTGVKAGGNDENIYNYVYPYVKTIWQRGLACFDPYHMIQVEYDYPACPIQDPEGEYIIPHPNCGETYKVWECNGPLRPEPWAEKHATDIYDYDNPIRIVDDINRTAANGCGTERMPDGGWFLSSGSLYQYVGQGTAMFGEGWGHHRHIGSTMCAWRCVK